MRKLTSIIILIAILTMTVLPVSAGNHHGGGHHGQRRARNEIRTVCDIEDCGLSALHYHGDRAYQPHYFGDGHDYHAYCQVYACDVAGYHEHDGIYCFERVRRDDESPMPRLGRGWHCRR